VAETLGAAFLDTGAMYRAATWWAMSQQVDLDDPDAVAAATESLPLELEDVKGRVRVTVDGRDVSEAIRTPGVTRLIHKLDENPRVRGCLVELQQQFGARGLTVAEGRDIGTVVFPKAKCKVYLDASLDERTRRRAAQLAEQGVDVGFHQLREELRERDRKNMTRDIAPLRKADDATCIDTTTMNLGDVVDAVVALARDAR
jgi:cytidylate kinase